MRVEMIVEYRRSSIDQRMVRGSGADVDKLRGWRAAAAHSVAVRYRG
jgi:hypothetical protein